MRTVGIIPARCSSKRLVHKNTAMLMGRTLVAWTMDAARASQLDHVFVSTDCVDVVAVANHEGIDIIHRPADLCTDTATTEAVLLHACEALSLDDADTIVCLQPTSPLRSSARIDEALAMMRDPHVDSVVAVVSDPPAHFVGYIGTDGAWLPAYDPNNRPRTQDLEWYRDCGALYATRVGLLRATGSRMSGDCRALVLGRHEAVDVDDAFDLEVAAMVMSRQLLRRTSPQLRDMHAEEAK